MKHQYKCKQCGFTADGERAGIDHEKQSEGTHSMEYIPGPTPPAQSEPLIEGTDNCKMCRSNQQVAKQRIADLERDNLLVCAMASKVADERDHLRVALERIVSCDKRLPDFTDNPQTMIAREALNPLEPSAPCTGRNPSDSECGGLR